jgi:LTXXQ motif family protein
MRRSGALLLAAAVAASIPSPPAQAGLGGLLGMMTAPLRLLGGHHHLRRHASRHEAPQAGSPETRTEAKSTAGSRTMGSAPAHMGGSDAYEDMLGYALWPAQYANRFWAHGYGDIGNALIEPVALTSTAGSAETADTGSTAAAWPAVCKPKARDVAEHMAEQIEQRVSLTAPQRASLDKLRDALAKAIDKARPICGNGATATPAARLQAVVDELWALRDAESLLRAPMADFYYSLDDAQKDKLIGVPPARGRRTAGARDDAGRICLQQAAAASDWPIRKIEETVTPTPEQRASLQALREKSAGLAQFLMASCPQQPAATPVDRLDSAGDRVNAMLYAAMSIAPELDAFYASLSDEQKAKLNALGG